MSPPGSGAVIGYEPDEPCPPLVALGVGLQGVILVLASIVSIVAVTARATDQDAVHLTWAVFACLVISGALTALQAGRFGWLGAGHVQITGPTPIYLGVSVLALAAGGPALLATLTVVAALFYLVLSLWLPRLRRIVTPVLSGTVIMLIAVTVLPIALDGVNEVPGTAPAAAGPVVALVTLTALVVLSLWVSGPWRIWTPLIAVAGGCTVAALFGAYDTGQIRAAAWVGLPAGGFTGPGLTFGVDFWALLPAFVVVALVGVIENIGDSVAIQQISWRKPRVTDFRRVQGTLNLNALGVLLSGLAGSPPTTVYASSSQSLIHFTGVAARRVGYAIGALLVALSLLPKVTAVIMSIPAPVTGAYVLAAIGLLFVSGIQTVVSDGLDRRKALAVGVAFFLGVGLDNRTFGTDLLGETWGPLIDSGLLVGALAAVLITRFMAWTDRSRRARIQVDLHRSAAGEIDGFLRGFASDIGWNEAAGQRLRSAGEETLMSLLQLGDDRAAGDTRRLIVLARRSGGAVEMEFLATLDEENLQDRLADLNDEPRSTTGVEDGAIPLGLLGHHASAVRHQKFHGFDVVTVRVTEPS